MTDFYDNSSYRWNKNLLTPLGLWPLQSGYRRFFWGTTPFISIFSIMIPEIIKMLESWKDIDMVYESVPPIGLHVANLVKLISAVRNHDKMKDLLTRIERDWRTRAKGGASDILRGYSDREKSRRLGYTYYLYISTFFYICLPFIPLALDIVKPLNETRPREPLFRTEFFIDEDKYWLPIFLHAFVTTAMSITIVVAFDTLFSGYITYLCSLFADLSRQIQEVEENTDVTAVNLQVRREEDRAFRKITHCVRNHKDALEFASILESTYSGYFFILTGVVVASISFTGVQTVMRLADIELALRYFCFTLGQTVHIFHSCYQAQRVSDHGEAFNEDIYKALWYNTSFRSRRLLLLMMMRSSEPLRLTGGGLCFIGMEMFSTIIRTAMSYFTVLTSLQ